MIKLHQLRALTEIQRYPSLLARLSQASSPAEEQTGTVLKGLLEPALEQGVPPEDRFRELIEAGELGAARVIGELTTLSEEQRQSAIFRRQARLQQDIEAQLRRVQGLVLLLQVGAPERARQEAAEEQRLSSDPVLKAARPGKLLRELQDLERRLEERIRVEIEAIRSEVEELRRSIRPSNERDLTLAIRRLEVLLQSEESLPEAQRLLLLARRARDGALSADDLRILHQQGAHRSRLVRTWATMAQLGVASPADVLKLLEDQDSPVRLTGDFDRRNVRDLFQSFLSSPLNTETAARRLFSFLGLPEGEVSLTRGALGSSVRLRIVEPRVPALRGGGGSFSGGIHVLLPLRADESMLPRLIGDAPTASLRIVVYPGKYEKPGQAPPSGGGAVVVIDLLDLLRMAECAQEQRLHALQQIILPRLPLALVKPYQGGGAVAPEMFRGRRNEIEKLKQARGKTVLFSGRMMGKSSILKKLELDIEAARDRGEANEIAVLVSNAGDDPLPRLIEKLSAALGTARGREFLAAEERVRSRTARTRREGRERTRERLNNLRRLLIAILETGVRLTILIDEADLFAAADAERQRDESLAWLLRDIEQERPEALRIVFAGFQTIHHQVLSSNGAFANWYGLQSVGPLERDDAEALVIEPLLDFGFVFASEAGVRRILDFTGRHPLLIQETCTRLMERIDARRRRTAEDELVQIQAGDVETVCREDHLRARVRQVLSLNLEQYPRLKLMVYLILYASSLPAHGARLQIDSFRLADLKRTLNDWYGDRFNDYFDERSIGLLVEELGVLGLLASRGGDSYEFVNRTFASMLSEDQRFEDELQKLLAQVTNPSRTEARRLWTLPEEHVARIVRQVADCVLVIGLPRTLKSDIASRLFRDKRPDDHTDDFPLLTSALGCSSLDDLDDKLQKELREHRKGLGNILAKHQVHRLVLDDADRLAAGEGLLSLLDELRQRKQRLIAFGGPALARHYVNQLALEHGVDVISLRRLEAQDIRAWGERGAGRSLDEYIIFDNSTSEILADTTGGYFPLIFGFWEFLQLRGRNTKEFIPRPDDVKAFARQLDGQAIEAALLSSLNEGERRLLGRLYRFAFDMNGWDAEWEYVEQDLEEYATESGADMSEVLDQLQVLELLDLVDFDTSTGKRRIKLQRGGPLHSLFVKR